MVVTGATATPVKIQVRDDVTDALINRAPVLTVDRTKTSDTLEC